MKKLIFLILAVAFSHTRVFSQGCLPEGITFTTQAQIDSFKSNYPICTEIEGDVTFYLGPIYNLNGLSTLKSIGGDLIFHSVYPLSVLTGLDSLTSIGGDLTFLSTEANNMTGLGSLSLIGGSLTINCHSHIGVVCKNPNLKSLTGLEALTNIGGSLSISDNPLTNIDALSALTSIDGDLWIASNDSLGNLSGINNLTSIGGSIFIGYNTSLSSCDVQSICNYLSNPNGTIEIHDNAPGCTSQEEVEAACQLDVQDLATNQELAIYPNPSLGQFTFEFSLQQQSRVQLIALNSLGQVVATPADGVLTPGPHQLYWYAGKLPAGMYYLQLKTENQFITKKIIKQ